MSMNHRQRRRIQDARMRLTARNFRHLWTSSVDRGSFDTVEAWAGGAVIVYLTYHTLVEQGVQLLANLGGVDRNIDETFGALDRLMQDAEQPF